MRKPFDEYPAGTELWDAVVSARTTGATLKETLQHVKDCWIESLRDDVKEAEKVKLP